MTKFYVEIPKQKAELPAIIVLGVVCFVGWAFHFGIWGHDWWFYLARIVSANSLLAL